jgi:hypothetical protein
MRMFEKYLEYAAAGDAEKVSSLFAEDGIFYDEGPKKMGMEPAMVQGREAVKAFFQQVFSTMGPINAFNVSINENAMRYDVKFGEMLVQALGVMKVENDLIKEYRVTVI